LEVEIDDRVYRVEKETVIFLDNRAVVNVVHIDIQEVVGLEIDLALVVLFSVVSNILVVIWRVIFFFLLDLAMIYIFVDLNNEGDKVVENEV